jgi:membrane-associated phospholipid phosphatase
VADDVKWPAAAAFACATMLGLLALLVYGTESFSHLDVELFHRLSAHHHTRWGEWAEAIALLADPLPVIGFLAAACGIALLRRRPAEMLAALAVVAGASLTTQLLKTLLSHPSARALLGVEAHAKPIAFPSGHTTAAFAIAIAFAFVVPRALQPATLLLGAVFGCLVGCSVVVIAWHYPSDALGGFLVAAGWGFAVLAVLRAASEPEPSEGAGLSPPSPLPSR